MQLSVASAAKFAGQGDTNNGSNSTGSTNDMQDVNSPLQDPGRISGTRQKPYDCFRSGLVQAQGSISNTARRRSACAQVLLQPVETVSALTQSEH